MRQLVFLGSCSVEVYLAGDLDRLGHGSTPSARAASPEDLARWMASPVDRHTLRRVLARAMDGLGAGSLADDEVVRHLRVLLHRRALVMRVLPPEPLWASDGQESEETPLPPREEAHTPKTWIEIQLVGEDDKPIPGVRYLLLLVDGSEQAGTLDSRGLARIDEIDPGMCEVHFPDLDRDAWVAI